ncbi:MAG: cytochrome c oxidase subunit II [Bacteroidetes bacterium]|nr:cytochrome c oxidase subunit II [Bacteroidota bacterium]MBL0276397.1 cytochrome c oxidase subunit II [Anaeromyxobacter sp.]
MNELLRNLLNLPTQLSQHARDVDGLHYFVVLTTMVVGAGILATSVWFMVRYRRRSEDEKTPEVQPRAIHEVLFIGVPLAFFLLWFAIGFPQFIDLTTPPPGAMDVFVQGKKWMWKFAYQGGPSSLDVLRVPAGRPVRLLITSRDVIHSFYVPDLRLKQDALPGRYTQTWFNAELPGRYPIYCAEYCGLSHSGMLGELVVMPAADFDAWVAEQRKGQALAQDGAATAGEAVLLGSSILEQGRLVAAQQGCLKCHSVDGSRHIGPTFLDLYQRKEKLSTGDLVDADEGYLTKSMMDPAAQVVAGYQNVMPSYQGRLTPPEVAAVLEYLKSLKTPAVHAGPSEGPVYESTPSK